MKTLLIATDFSAGAKHAAEYGYQLAMVRRSRSFISSLLTGSHTKKMARHIGIPLLVIPEN